MRAAALYRHHSQSTFVIGWPMSKNGRTSSLPTVPLQLAGRGLRDSSDPGSQNNVRIDSVAAGVGHGALSREPRPLAVADVLAGAAVLLLEVGVESIYA